MQRYVTSVAGQSCSTSVAGHITSVAGHISTSVAGHITAGHMSHL